MVVQPPGPMLRLWFHGLLTWLMAIVEFWKFNIQAWKAGSILWATVPVINYCGQAITILVTGWLLQPTVPIIPERLPKKTWLLPLILPILPDYWEKLPPSLDKKTMPENIHSFPKTSKKRSRKSLLHQLVVWFLIPKQPIRWRWPSIFFRMN